MGNQAFKEYFQGFLEAFGTFLALIQICRNLCISVSIYVIAKVSLRAGVDLGTRAGPGSGLGESSPGKPKIIKSDTLAGLFLFAIVLLSYIIALLSYMVVLLRAKSLSSSLGVAELCGKFFWWMAILKQSKVEWKRETPELF